MKQNYIYIYIYIVKVSNFYFKKIDYNRIIMFTQNNLIIVTRTMKQVGTQIKYQIK
jgi:hypothetical protein